MGKGIEFLPPAEEVLAVAVSCVGFPTHIHMGSSNGIPWLGRVVGVGGVGGEAEEGNLVGRSERREQWSVDRIQIH